MDGWMDGLTVQTVYGKYVNEFWVYVRYNRQSEDIHNVSYYTSFLCQNAFIIPSTLHHQHPSRYVSYLNFKPFLRSLTI